MRAGSGKDLRKRGTNPRTRPEKSLTNNHKMLDK